LMILHRLSLNPYISYAPYLGAGGFFAERRGVSFARGQDERSVGGESNDATRPNGIPGAGEDEHEIYGLISYHPEGERSERDR